MTKKRGSGSTETFSVSVDSETRRQLEALAEEHHEGNVSALIKELAVESARKAAFERAWAWYGGPEPTAAEAEAIRAEWQAG